MKKFALKKLALVTLTAFSGALMAANVTVDIDGKAQTYKLENLSINSQGNVSIRATGGNGNSGGGGTTPVDPKPPVEPEPPVVDPQPPVGPGADCVETDNLKCVATTVGQKAGNIHPSTTVRPAPSLVTAYRFETLPGQAAYAGSAIATRTTGAFGKRVVISTVPGDLTEAGKDRGCIAESSEVSAVSYVVNASKSTLRFCHLQPGQTYYVNVAAIAKADGKPNCTSEINCSYLFELK